MIKKMLGAAMMASVVMLPLPAMAQDTSEDEAAATTGGAGSSEAIILALLALGAVGAGIYVAVDSEEDDAPVSP